VVGRNALVRASQELVAENARLKKKLATQRI
jgi:hypothetical protein